MDFLHSCAGAEEKQMCSRGDDQNVFLAGQNEALGLFPGLALSCTFWGEDPPEAVVRASRRVAASEPVLSPHRP